VQTPLNEKKTDWNIVKLSTYWGYMVMQNRNKSFEDLAIVYISIKIKNDTFLTIINVWAVVPNEAREETMDLDENKSSLTC
jgi:hypothetical protein